MGRSGPRWLRRLLRTKVGHPLVRGAVMNDGAAIKRAVLALITSAVHVPGRHRNRVPPLYRPARVIHSRGVLITRDFTANGPIQAENGRRVVWRRGVFHGWFSLLAFGGGADGSR
jgi:hypothetical protein